MMLNFAIVGCGRIAQRHAEQIKKNGTLVAVCDVVIDTADDLASQYNANAYYKIEELLSKEKAIDVIAICTPNGLHAQHSIQCLQYGINVLCEKPLALKTTDCVKMIEVAKQFNKGLFSIKQNRFNPPVEAVKKIIDEGKLGKIYSIQLSCFWNRGEDYYKSSSWKGKKEMDGGTLCTQFSHFIDLLYWMFGDISDAEAYTANYSHQNLIEFEDTGVVIIKFKSGAIGTVNYTINSYDKNMEGSLTIFGEKGTVKIGGQYLNELEYQNIEGYKIENLPTGNTANNYGNYQGSMSNHNKVYQNLIDVLQNNASISASAFDGLKTVEIIEMIYEKSRYLC